MTIEKIVEEMKKRYAALESRESELRSKARAFRHREPFASLTDDEINQNRDVYNTLDKLEQPFYDKIRKIEREKSIIRDMLWEYEKNG